MWFHLELKGQGYNAARTGLAIGDKITGPYQYQKSFRPNAGQWPINMTPEQIQADPGCKILRRDFEKGQMARDMEPCSSMTMALPTTFTLRKKTRPFISLN